MVSDTNAMPMILPIISGKGCTEPSSTSAMRCIFSSMTPCSSGAAPISTIMNMRTKRPPGSSVATMGF